MADDFDAEQKRYLFLLDKNEQLKSELQSAQDAMGEFLAKER